MVYGSIASRLDGGQTVTQNFKQEEGQNKFLWVICIYSIGRTSPTISRKLGACSQNKRVNTSFPAQVFRLLQRFGRFLRAPLSSLQLFEVKHQFYWSSTKFLFLQLKELAGDKLLQKLHCFHWCLISVGGISYADMKIKMYLLFISAMW